MLEKRKDIQSTSLRCFLSSFSVKKKKSYKAPQAIERDRCLKVLKYEKLKAPSAENRIKV